jgi:hypothetical protein
LQSDKKVDNLYFNEVKRNVTVVLVWPHVCIFVKMISLV